MTLLWEKSLSVNCEEIDTQHKNLIDAAQKVQSALATGANRKTCAALFGDLLRLAQNHSEAEEAFLLENQYSGFEAHRKEHQKAMEQAAMFLQMLEKGEWNIVLFFAGYLADWLMNHIRNADLEYCRQIFSVPSTAR